jgi:hypothetical protein
VRSEGTYERSYDPDQRAGPNGEEAKHRLGVISPDHFEPNYFSETVLSW